MALDENPRYSSELRSMRCEQSLLNKTDGSASFLQGAIWYLFIPTLSKLTELIISCILKTRVLGLKSDSLFQGKLK